MARAYINGATIHITKETFEMDCLMALELEFTRMVIFLMVDSIKVTEGGEEP